MNNLNRNTGFLLIFEALLLFVPLFILGTAIDWPASLDEPATAILPRIYEQASTVQSGYVIYMIYSLLFWPVSLLIIHRAAGSDDYGPLLRIAAGLGIASAVLRTLGIIRWLVPMPVLAEQYVDPATSEATRESIIVTYNMLNDYAGSVGEILGVSLFAALWALIVGYVILRDGRLPRWLGGFGVVAGAGLMIPIVEMFGTDAGPFVTISVVVLHLWLLALGITVLTGRLPAVQPVTSVPAYPS